jgi:hypothetical protein
MTAPPMKLVANQRNSVKRETAPTKSGQQMFFLALLC